MPFEVVTLGNPERYQPTRVGYPARMRLSPSPPNQWVKEWNSLDWQTVLPSVRHAPTLLEGSIYVPGSAKPEDLKETLDAIKQAVADVNNQTAIKIAEEEEESTRAAAAAEAKTNALDAVLDEWVREQGNP